MVSVERFSFHVELLIFYFLNLKETCYKKEQKTGFSGLSKYMWLSIGHPLQRLIAESPLTFMAEFFPHFPLESSSEVCSNNKHPTIG